MMTTAAAIPSGGDDGDDVDIAFAWSIWWICLTAIVVVDYCDDDEHDCDNSFLHSDSRRTAVRRRRAGQGGGGVIPTTTTVGLLFWLIASLQNSSSSSSSTGQKIALSIWAHVVLGGIVMSHHIKTLLIFGIPSFVWQQERLRLRLRRQPTKTGHSNYCFLPYQFGPRKKPTTATTGAAKSLLLLLLLQSMVPAAFVALSMQVINGTRTESNHDIISFVVAYGVILLYKLCCCCCCCCCVQRRGAAAVFGTATRQSYSSNETTMPKNTTTGGTDESLWYEWTPSQVVDWIDQVLEQQQQQPRDDNDDDCSGDRLLLLLLLENEDICGYQLPLLTLHDWRSIGLSTGVALMIYTATQNGPCRRYPVPNNSDNNRYYWNSSTAAKGTGWLEELDREQKQQQQQQQHQSNDSHSPQVYGYCNYSAQRDNPMASGGGEEEMARSMMNERFGGGLVEMIVPALARPLPDEGGRRYTLHSTSTLPERHQQQQHVPWMRTGEQEHEAASSPPSSFQSATSPHSFEASSVHAPPDDNGLANLPAHIADIVRRRPELVQQALLLRKTTRQPGDNTSGTPKLGEPTTDRRKQQQQQQQHSWRNAEAATIAEEDNSHAWGTTKPAGTPVDVDSADDNDDEFTVLLTSRPQQEYYKSIPRHE
jgi:hypothetical protein